MNEKIEIKHDADGFLVPRKDHETLERTWKNTEELLKRENGTINIANPLNKRTTPISIVVQSPVVSKSKSINHPRKEDSTPLAVSSSAVVSSKRKVGRPRKNEHAPVTSNRPTPIQQRTEKLNKEQFRESKKQTEALTEIVRQGKNKKGGIGSGLMSLLGMGGGIVKGALKSPANLIKGGIKGAKAVKSIANKGKTYVPIGSISKNVGKLSKLSGLMRGIGKGGALAALGALFSGLNVENANMSRGQKNKAHAGNLASAGGGLAGAFTGAKLGGLIGSFVPVFGTTIGAIVGGILGGFSGTILTDKFVGWLGELIDPTIGKHMFESWDGFTLGVSNLWRNLTSDARFSWTGFVNATKNGWDLFTDFAQTSWQGFMDFSQKSAQYIWNDLMPESIKTHFATVTSDAQQAWGTFKDSVSPYFAEAGNYAKSAWDIVSENSKVFWTELKEKASAVWDFMKEVGADAFNSLKNSNFGQYVGEAANNVSGFVQEKWGEAKQWIGSKTAQGAEYLKQAGSAAASFLGYDMTKKYDYLRYQMGGKSLNRGTIDCSGWSFQISKMEMENLNQMLGFEKYKIKGNQAGIFNAGMHGAAEQIGLGSQQYGVVTDTRDNGGFDVSKLKAGMMIGQRSMTSSYKGRSTNVKGYGDSIYNHIVKVVRGRNGKLYISESRGGKGDNGVMLTEVNEWVRSKVKAKSMLTAVNPYGDDIELLNGNLGAIAKNEAGKVITKTGNAVKSGMERVANAIIPNAQATDISTPTLQNQGNNIDNIRFQGKNQHNQRLIAQLAQKHGLDPAAFLAMSHIETGGQFNDKAYHKGSGASGLFQFIPSTQKAYGLGGGKVWDATANTEAAIKMTQENRHRFIKKMHREPTVGELYLMHQQGFSGAMLLLQNRNMNAIQALQKGGIAKARDAILGNGGNVNMSAGEYAAMWEDRIAKIYQIYTGKAANQVILAKNNAISIQATKSIPPVKNANIATASVSANVSTNKKVVTPNLPTPPINLSMPKTAAEVAKTMPIEVPPIPAQNMIMPSHTGAGNDGMKVAHIAHQPIGQTVSQPHIAWLASGGITGKDTR